MTRIKQVTWKVLTAVPAIALYLVIARFITHMADAEAGWHGLVLGGVLAVPVFFTIWVVLGFLFDLVVNRIRNR